MDEKISPAIVFIILVLAVLLLGGMRGGTDDTEPVLRDGGEAEKSSLRRSGTLLRGKSLVSQRRQAEVEAIIDSYRERSLISQYAGGVILHAGTASGRDPEREYLELRISEDTQSSTPLTGWRLMSRESGIERRIGTVVYTPLLGQRNTPQAIAANPGDTIFLISGKSPIGYSFLSNTCSGYLEQNNDFFPSLSRSCPRPEAQLTDEQLFGENKFSDQCLSIIERIPTCSTVERELPVTVSRECAMFIKRQVNYNACVFAHGGTSSFHGDEWRVYFGSEGDLWGRDGEILLLLDSRGALVDIISL